MRLSILTIGAIAATAAAGLFAASQSNANQSAERTFADELARGNVAEIQLGQLAQQKASNPIVKDFAARMVADHTALNNDLKTWAQKHNVSLSTNLSAVQTQERNKLQNLSGQAFDKEYISDMLRDHQQDIQNVQQIALTTQNPMVKRLSEQNLPVIENHIRIAEHVAGQIGVAESLGLNQPIHPTDTTQSQ